MIWEFDGRGQWERSAKRDTGQLREFCIQVCDDGTFDVSQSTPELLGYKKIDTFATFSDAADYCDSMDVVDGFELHSSE